MAATPVRGNAAERPGVAVLWALLAVAFLAAPCFGAMPDGFNHSEYRWLVIETPHFRILYPQGMEHTAECTAAEAERAYPFVTRATGVEPHGKTDVILTDHEPAGDYSGRAYPFSHRIWLQSTAIFGPRGDVEATLGDVVSHEFVHVCTFWAERRGGLGSVREAADMLFMPFWFVEGLAETVAENPPGSLGTSAVRSALLEGGLPDIAQLSVGDYDDLPTMTFTYRVGQGMVETIREEWGSDALARILREHARLPVFGRALRKAIGMSEEELFDHWRRRTRVLYERLVEGRDDVREYSTAVLVPAQRVISSAWSPDGRRIAVPAYKDVEEPVAQLLVGRADGSGFHAIADELDPLRSARMSWSPDGRYLAYAGLASDSGGRVTDRLWIHDTESGKRRALPLDGQAMDIAWSPDGGRIALVLLRDSGQRRDLITVRPDVPDLQVLTGRPGMPTSAYAPAWSPDGREIACEVYEGSSRPNIAILRADGSSYERLTDDKDANRLPTWSPDGRTIAFICDRDVLPDLWSVDLETRTFRKHTNERVAHVGYPTFSPDGRGVTVTLARARTAALWMVPLGHVVATLTPEEKSRPAQDERPPAWLVGGYPGEGRAPWAAASADRSEWRRYAYKSGHRFRTDYSSADLSSLRYGFYRASDPLNQQAFQIEPGYSAQFGRPTLDALYENAEGRVTLKARAFSIEPSQRKPGGSLLTPAGTGADLRASLVRAVGGSALRRETFELAVHGESAGLEPAAGSPALVAPHAGRLAFLEGRWTRRRQMPTQGQWDLSVVGRQSLPGLSSYPLQELLGSLQWTHSSSAGRQKLILGLGAGWARGLSFEGRPIRGAYVAPSLAYEFRLADDMLPGLWPYLYLDRLEGRVSYEPTYTFGAPLYQGSGRLVRFEVENRGYLSKVPYRLRVGATMDTRRSSLRPEPYVTFGLYIPAF